MEEVLIYMHMSNYETNRQFVEIPLRVVVSIYQTVQHARQFNVVQNDLKQ